MKMDFDKRKLYEEQIESKVIELKQLCHMHKIPLFISLCLANNAQETIYEKEMVSSATCNYELTDDQIIKHVNVTLGFDTIQPTSEAVLEMDDMEVNYIEENKENEEEGDTINE